MMISRLNVVYWLISWVDKEQNKVTVEGNQEYNQYTFRTVSFKVSSFVGNPVSV